MSGVCAAISRTRADVDPIWLDALVAAAPHRATGGVGRHLTGTAALAQLGGPATSGTPAAPVVHGPTGVAVVADARIDNLDELGSALGTSAPEPGSSAGAWIAATYLRWGLDALPRLIGDFALVVWDPRCRRLLLARDPMAMRALYLRLEPDRVLVATEVRQLLAVPGVPDEPDERMIASYLCGSFGALDWTYHRGIDQLPPSHALTVTDTEVRTWRYWDVDPAHRVHHATAQGYADHLRELFLDAVRARSRGGRPSGVLLSGGIDSGATASAAGWILEREREGPPLHSYSWDFGTATGCDEREVSRHIVARYGLRAHDVPVEDAGPLAGYPAHAPHPDDPFHGHFQTMLDRGFARARDDGVGPVFTGMRGDLCVGPTDLPWAGPLRSSVRWLRRQRHGASASDETPAWIAPGLARRVELSDLLTTYAEVPTPPLRGVSRRRRYQWIFTPMHLRWAVSHERRAAGFGLEAVDAWSDRRLVEFCLAVPQRVLDRPPIPTKALARAALAGIVPRAFLDAAGKTRPMPVYLDTLRGPAVPTVRALLHGSRAAAAGWVDPASLRRSYDDFLRGAPVPDGLWWALSLEWWLRVREARPTGGPTAELDR